MEVIRTPEERFVNLPDFAFQPNYVEIDDLRMHYIDEGPRSGALILLLHGEPTWSFLYRKMIPVLTAAGHRVIAPDLIGFGRSDKLTSRDHYTYARHVAWMTRFLAVLDLKNIVLVAHDWGGLIGLRVLAEQEACFSRVVAMNTALPTGDLPAPPAFLEWQRFSQETPVFSAGKIVQSMCQSPLDKAVLAAYDAPFPDERYLAGARQFPMLVPTSPDDPASDSNRKAWEVLRRFTKPFLTVYGDQDPITRKNDRYMQRKIPGAQGVTHTTMVGAGHFLQEDKAEELAKIISAFV